MSSGPSVDLPKELSGFVTALKAAIPKSSIDIDRPDDSRGEWWLDIAHEDFRSSVAWRPERGFGVFTSGRGYMDKPDEVYRSPDLATKRVQQLLRHWTESCRLVPLSLTDLRQLREKRQTAVAAALHINQGAVSRFEHREDMRLSSLQSYVRAMGGRLEMRVHFDSFEAAISVSESTTEFEDET
jgi:hypothetical protein